MLGGILQLSGLLPPLRQEREDKELSGFSAPWSSALFPHLFTFYNALSAIRHETQVPKQHSKRLIIVHS